ncbi:hypothetical protein [Rhizobium sp. Root483D2]|uniref:hypothetical protein n=1 Tax=Rhizobium sp. Root483D2 TaxID=1736545 RepID=UPI0012E362AF|nr:hypothetical protein [Rhizobium sp. Root483D2]
MDAKLPIECRRPTIKCFIEIGGQGPVRYRHPPVECGAIIDTGANMCAAKPSVIPSGVFPIGFHEGAENVIGGVREHARYWARFSFPMTDRMIEVEVIDYEVSGLRSDVLLGTPFLAFAGLHVDAVKGERYLWIYGS